MGVLRTSGLFHARISGSFLGSFLLSWMVFRGWCLDGAWMVFRGWKPPVKCKVTVYNLDGAWMENSTGQGWYIFILIHPTSKVLLFDC